MPPRASSRVHVHEHSDIIVIAVAGHALTLTGPDLTPHIHAAGEFIFVPAGVLHMAVNLSSSSPLTAVEVRTDPEFNDDVVLCPDREIEAKLRAEELRKEFETEQRKRADSDSGFIAPWMIRAHECVRADRVLKHSD
ncbi:cupin domain-containing protein [Pseudonocardia sp. ICBG601]|uniref:cupin domain-containing protein n=1 Tax=Pseudonocardia sp. ICBG601 TaxID=2846759 RepID=UPI0035ABAE51